MDAYLLISCAGISLLLSADCELNSKYPDRKAVSKLNRSLAPKDAVEKKRIKHGSVVALMVTILATFKEGAQ